MQEALDRTRDGRKPRNSPPRPAGQAATREWKPGHVLAGRYQIREKIGEGTTGIVYRVLDRERLRDMAIKVIYPWLLPNQEARARFRDDAALACELYHPAIANLIGHQTHGNVHFLVMELLQGQTLRQWLDSRRKSRKPLDTDTLCAIIKTLSSALHYAHNKTVHANLKPDNIWIDEGKQLKIMDFGVASLVRASAARQSARDALYRAPELADSTVPANRLSDQYSLGVVMLELHGGEPTARRIRTARQKFRNQPQTLSQVIARMLAVDPGERFEGGEQVGHALGEIKSHPRTLLPRPLKIGLLTLILLGASGWAVYESRDRFDGLRQQALTLWETWRPVSAGEQQLQFAAVIERVNEVNGLNSRLDRGQRELEVRLKSGRDQLRSLTSQAAEAPADDTIGRQIDQVRTTLERDRALAGLVARIAFEDYSPPAIEAGVRSVLALIEANEYDQAIARIEPLQTELRQRFQRFNRADDYIDARIAMTSARTTWSNLVTAESLQPPAQIMALAQAIPVAEALADQGRLVEAIRDMTRIESAYREAHDRNLLLLAQRDGYRAQQDRSRRLEREWNRYLGNNRLAATSEQTASLAELRARESASIEGGDFVAAEAVSREIETSLEAYFDDARSLVAENRRQQTLARQRASRQNFELALDRGRTALERSDYDQAIIELRQALEIVPGNSDAGRLLDQALERRVPPAIKRYAPGVELARIAAGSFSMGGPGADEQPVRRVGIDAFNIMKHEVTFAQYDLYAEITGRARPDDAGWGRGSRPVINVNWQDANAYAEWLTRTTGFRFRLPTEAEWEYAARAGTTTAYPWGETASRSNANYGAESCCGGSAAGPDQWIQTSPVGSFPANAFGMSDMHGNVTEWVQDCWNPSYSGAPVDGSAWLTGDCKRRVTRGGTWSGIPEYIRSASRDGIRAVKRTGYIGFRLVQEP